MRSALKLVWRLCVAMGVMTLLAVVWLALGGRMVVDEWLDVTEPPHPAAAIVVLAGGTNGGNLPLQQGWERLTAASELFADGLAPVMILSGGGTSRVAEAEVYANAAAWLGVPRAAMHFESTAGGTRDHGPALLGFALPDGGVIGTDTPLLVVTSRLHSRRALLSFHRAGFTHVRVVSAYSARRGPNARVPPPGSPAALTSTVADHRPSGKRYDDPLFRLAYRSFDLFMGLREVGAIWVE